MRAPRTALSIAALLGACGTSEGRVPCLHWEDTEAIRLSQVFDVDLVIVVDDSGSGGAHRAFFDELPRLVRAIATGDVDGDSIRDANAARSVRVGVVTSDLGADGHGVPGCGAGGDAVLLEIGDASVASCAPIYPRVQLLEPGGDVDAFAAAVRCVAGDGTGGCTWRQPLEVALRALSPSMATEWTALGYVPPPFASGSGHALGANAGFGHVGSVLAIVLVTDEDDCSVEDPSVLDPSDASWGEYGLRCGLRPEALHAIERYAIGETGHAGLARLRARPDVVVFAAIAGVPADTPRGPVDYDALLGRPEMQLAPDPADPTRLAPSCALPGAGVALPPRRIVQTARALERAGARTTVQSLCGPDLRAPIDEIAFLVVDSLADRCLSPSSFDGRCELYELLHASDASSCEELPGRIDAGTILDSGERRTRCLLRRLEPGAVGPGWIVEGRDVAGVAEECATGDRFRFVGVELRRDSETRIACHHTLAPGGGSCE
jgi:hypothetical protein